MFRSLQCVGAKISEKLAVELLKLLEFIVGFLCSKLLRLYIMWYRAIAAALRAYLFTAASERVVARLRENLFGHLINQVNWSTIYCFLK